MSLSIKHITKHFGGIHAIDNCSMEIEEGKITAIIGPNGSGKSTLFNMISQLIDEDHGTIEYKGKQISKLRDFEVARAGISRTFQEVRLFQNLTIKEHLEIDLGENDESLWRSLLLPEKVSKMVIQEILETIDLKKPEFTLATDLSYGQRKLLDLGIALASSHTILLLDEPVAGVNPALREQIKKVLKRLNSAGETILLIEHDMNFVMDLAHTIIVLDAGKVIAHGTPKEIQKNKAVLDAYLGE